MEFLKEILGDKYPGFEALINAHNSKPENKDKQVKLADLSSGEYVGKGKYATLETEVADLKEQVKTAEGTIKTLKKENADNEALQSTIKTHETTIATMKTEYETKIKDMAIDSAIKAQLTDTKYPDLLVGKFDRSKLALAADGSVVGIDEQLTSIKETYADMFTVDVKGSKDPNNKNRTSSYTGKNPWSKEHFNLTEQARILRENPELATQLKQSI